MSDTLTLIHQPAGRQHPYEYAPYERSPYLPVAGEEVHIGIVARDVNHWQEVAVEWRNTQDAHWQHVAATLTRTGQFDLRADEVAAGAANDNHTSEVEEHWMATLPAGAAHARIVYRIVGTNSAGVWRSEIHAYGIAGWQEAVPAQVDDGQIVYHLAESQRPVTLRWRADADGIVLCWNTPAPEALQPTPTDITITLDDAGCLQIAKSGTQILQEARRPEFLFDAEGGLVRVRHAFVATADEAFYGLGERYNALNQRGQALDVRVYEQYKGQGKRTYMPVPLLHSSRGHSLYLHSDRWSYFDLCATDPGIWQVEAQLGTEENLVASLFTQGNIAANLRAYCQRTGFPVVPPEWAFGLWGSSNDWDSQQHVEHEVAQARLHDIPLSVVVLEAWSDEINFYIWNGAEYTPRAGADAPRLADFHFPPNGKWSNPKAMIDALHAEGIRLVLWQIPVLKHPTEAALMHNVQHDADEAHMLSEGYAVRMPDGSPYRVRPPWFRGSLLPDFTSPEASAWWMSKRRYLIEEMGVDGFKTDGGEHLWSREARFADGRSGEELWNAYPVEYTRAYTQLLNDTRAGDALLFSRAGYAGSQKYPAHWTGDEVSTWEAYRASLLAMLTSGLSGIPFIGWDIGGFSGPLPSAELYLRAAAMSVFCPIMQYHSEYWRGTPLRDRSPWNMQACTGDERIIPTFRRFVQWRNALHPYILNQAMYSGESGMPLMRALPIEFPQDAQAAAWPLQYLFGDALLIAPVTEAGVTQQSVYLPQGAQWRDLWSDAEYAGGQVVEVATPIDRIPLFLRVGYANPIPALH